MNQLLQIATQEISIFLARTLPEIDSNWWDKLVVGTENIAVKKQNLIRAQKLERLDLQQLLRIIDANWRNLSDVFGYSPRLRNWIKELQTTRNEWAHASSSGIAAEDILRGSDTIGRILKEIGGSADAINQVRNLGLISQKFDPELNHIASGIEAYPPMREEKNKNTLHENGYRSGKSASTQINYINRYNQKCCGHRNTRGTDHGQFAYKMTCLNPDCLTAYGTNGTNVFQAKCPKCQNGKSSIQF